MELLHDVTGHAFGPAANASQVFWLPTDTPFGNLSLKLIRVIERLGHANLRITEAHKYWVEFVGQQAPGDDNPGSRHRYSTEEAVFMMRRAADELIAMLSMLEERKRTGRYPTRLAIDSLGRALHSDVEVIDPGHRWLTETLNDLANAHKHSFVDSDLTIVGRDEPCATALRLDRNDLTNDSQLYVVSLNHLVTMFNAFLNDTLNAIHLAGGILPSR